MHAFINLDSYLLATEPTFRSRDFTKLRFFSAVCFYVGMCIMVCLYVVMWVKYQVDTY